MAAYSMSKTKRVKTCVWCCGSVAGYWMFADRRWRDPGIETDRTALEAGYDELVAAFPGVSRCSREHFIGTIADVCASWADCKRDATLLDSSSGKSKDQGPQPRKSRGRRSTSGCGTFGDGSGTACISKAHAPKYSQLPSGSGEGNSLMHLGGDQTLLCLGPTDPASASPALGSGLFRPISSAGAGFGSSSDSFDSSDTEGLGGGSGGVGRPTAKISNGEDGPQAAGSVDRGAAYGPCQESAFGEGIEGGAAAGGAMNAGSKLSELHE